MLVILRLAFLSLCLAIASCSDQSQRGAVDAHGWRIAFEVVDSGKIAVCELSGADFALVTPDSLIAAHPATDSSGKDVYFTARTKSLGTSAIYSVQTDGANLRKIIDLPFAPTALAISPSRRVILAEGHYEEDPSPRLYRVAAAEGRMRPVTPASIPTANPVFSPEGSTFLFNDLRSPDTVWIGFVAGSIPLPLNGVPYRQCSIHRDGFSVVGIAGPRGNELHRYFFAAQKDTILARVPDGAGQFANPVFHAQGSLICLEEIRPDGSSRIAIYDPGSTELNYIPFAKSTVRKPIWVR